jgi:hypothetical protein
MLRQAEAQAQAQAVQMRFQMKQQSDPGGAGESVAAVDKVTAESVSALATRIAQAPPEAQEAYLERIRQLDSKFAGLLEKALANMAAGRSPIPTPQEMQMEQQQQQQQPPMDPATAGAPVADPQQQQPDQQQQPEQVVDMRPAPQQRPPRRQGGI